MSLTDTEDPPPNEAPTRPHASDAPIPPLDSLPAGMSAETPTEPAPDEIRNLLFKILDEQKAGFALCFEQIGELRESHEAFAVHVDKRLDEILSAAKGAGNGALESVAAVHELRGAIAEQSTHDKARLATVELRNDGLEERVERLEAATGGE